MSDNALLLVDLQNDFLPGGALGVPGGHQVIPVANRMAERFDLVIATQDWHPREHHSFATAHPGRRVGEVIDLHGLPHVLWPVHCVRETSGAAFAPELDVGRIHHVVRKGTDPDIDSYSGFFDNGHRKATGLHEYLGQKGVRHVYVLGIATDYCVKFTVLDARQLGLNVTVVEDGCRGVDLTFGDSARAIEEMQAAGARLINSAAWG